MDTTTEWLDTTDYPEPTCTPIVDGAGITMAFLGDNLTMFLLLGVLIIVILSLVGFEIYWRRASQGRMEDSRIRDDVEKLSVLLVERFLPSIAVGRYRFRGMRPKPDSKRISLEFEELALDLNNGKRVLDGVTGEFKSGRMAAIMGPSGAGKTTFMNVLVGKATYGKMSGTVSVNGEATPVSKLRSVMGFVPQDDIVHEVLTVRENIKYSMELRTRPGYPEKRRTDIVEDVLAVMQMSHIQNNIVGSVENRGISGGQRKRVNIGLELASCPTLLFLDEPTSGLDATSSVTIINSLKKMCELGMTIILVLHQPRYSLYTLFDDILLLGKGGRTVFIGPSVNTLPYLERLGFRLPQNENPADWFMDIISGEMPNVMHPNFRPSDLMEKWEELKSQALPPPMSQLSQRVSLSAHEDQSALDQSLKELWEAVDVNSNGFMEPTELKQLLCGIRDPIIGDPDARTVRQLMRRMGGDKDIEHVTQKEFTDYLIGLSKTVATDMGLQYQTSDMHLHDNSDEEDEDDENDTDQSGTDDSMEEGASEMTKVRNKLSRKQKGFCAQYVWIVHRRLVQVFRSRAEKIVDLFLYIGLAGLMGFLHRKKTGPGNYGFIMNLLIFHLGLGLLAAVSATNLFPFDRTIFWRESSSGLNVLSFCLARMTVDTFFVLTHGFVFTLVYFWMSQPAIHFTLFYWPCLMVSLCGSGWGYFASTFVPQKNAVLTAGAAILVTSTLIGNPTYMADWVKTDIQQAIMSISIVVWSMPMTLLTSMEEAKAKDGCVDDLVTMIAEPYNEVWLIKSLGPFKAGLLALGTIAVSLRAGAYLGLRFAYRNKQV